MFRMGLLASFAVVGVAVQVGGLGSAGAQCVPPPAGLTHWWPGNGDTRDIVGGLDATLRGDATFGDGWVDEAFLLDGDGDFIDVPDHPELNVGRSDFTVDLWVRFDNTQGEQVLIEKFVSNDIGWTLTKMPDNTIRLAITADANIDSAPQNLPLDTWIFFAARRDGDRFTVFRNNLAIAAGTSSANLDSSSSLKFGHRGNPSDTPGAVDIRQFFLDGSIDEVELFNGRALSTREIRSIFAAGADGKCEEKIQSAPALSPPFLALLVVVLAAVAADRVIRRRDSTLFGFLLARKEKETILR